MRTADRRLRHRAARHGRLGRRCRGCRHMIGSPADDAGGVIRGTRLQRHVGCRERLKSRTDADRLRSVESGVSRCRSRKYHGDRRRHCRHGALRNGDELLGACKRRPGRAGSSTVDSPRPAGGAVSSVGEPPDGGAQVGCHPGQLVHGGAGLAERLGGGVRRRGDAGDVGGDLRRAARRPPAPTGTSRWWWRSAPPPPRRWWSAGRRSARRSREISSIAVTAAVVSPWIASTRRAMSSVAFAVSCASSLTSLATTAKPLPASPARAASIVAFSASRLVCSAMLGDHLDDVADLRRGLAQLGDRGGRRGGRGHGLAPPPRWPPRRSTRSPGSRHPSARHRRRRSARCARPPPRPTATTPDCAEVSPAEAEICADDADSSSDDAATASAEAAISPTVVAIVPGGAVQGRGHLAELVAAAHRQADGQVALGHPLEAAPAPP